MSPSTRRFEMLLSLGLLFILFLAAVISLVNAIWGPDWASLWPILVFGLLLGWLLGNFKQPVHTAILVIVVVGFLYIISFPAGLSRQAGIVSASSFHVLSSFFSATSSTNWSVNLGALILAWQDLLSVAGNVLGGVWAWFEALMINPSAFDPLAASLVWDSLIWLASAWAGWVIVVRRDALLAVFPGIMISVVELTYSQRISPVLYVVMGTTLLLLAVVQFERSKKIWDESGVAYPRKKGSQVAWSALVCTVGLVLLSATLSSNTFQHFQNWVAGQTTLNYQSAQNVQATPAAQKLPAGIITSPGQPHDLIINTSSSSSDRVVITVSVGNLTALLKNGQLPPLYWRSATYDLYTGHGWTTSAIQSNFYQAFQPIQENQANGSITVDQDVFPVENTHGIIYAAGEPMALSLPSEAAWRSPGDLFGLSVSGSTYYQVFSQIPVMDVSSLRAAGQDYPDWVRQNYFALPQGIPARVKALASQLTNAQSTVFDRAMAIENYLRTYQYSQDVATPPKQQDVVDYFLFDLKKGYCDYYASAMVVLAREIGIPARLAIGYANGTYNLNSKRFVVTEADAHSWVEVYFPGIGWVPFEPTANSPVLENLGQFSSLPVQGPIFGITNRQSGNSFPHDWLPLSDIFIMAIITFIVVIILKEINLRLLSEKALAEVIYRHLKRIGFRLGNTMDAGVTPYEFSASLQMEIQKQLVRRKLAPHVENLRTAIDQLIDEIVLVCYRPTSSQKKQLLREWQKLRWQLELVWLLKEWSRFISHFKIHHPPIGIPPEDQT